MMSGLCLDIMWGLKGRHRDRREQAVPPSASEEQPRPFLDAAHHFVDTAHLLHHPQEIRRQQGLGAVAEGSIGLAVGLHQQTIGPGRHGGPGARDDQVTAAGGLASSTDGRPSLERLAGTGGEAGRLARSILSRG